MVSVADLRAAFPIARASNVACAAVLAMVAAASAGTTPAATEALASAPSNLAMAASSAVSDSRSAQASSQNTCCSTRLLAAPDLVGGLDAQAQLAALGIHGDL